MRRYLPLLLVSVFVITLILVGSFYLSDGHADKQHPENIQSINVYTSLPIEQVAILAQEYEKINKVRVNITPMSSQDILTRMPVELEQAADLVLTNRYVLSQLADKKQIIPYTSESTDIIPYKFKDEDDCWTGIWYDPIVFAINNDYKIDAAKPLTWADFIVDNKVRIGITDFLAAEASSNLLFTLSSVYGEQKTLDIFKKVHPHIVQYAKYLSTPARMAGMGECDIAIAVQSETIKYIKDGFPLKIKYPEDGTAVFLTGIAIAKNAPHKIDAQHFYDWILQKDAQTILQNNKYYLVPTNPEVEWFKEYIPNVKLWNNDKLLKLDEQLKLLDKWVKDVRFAK